MSRLRVAACCLLPVSLGIFVSVACSSSNTSNPPPGPDGTAGSTATAGAAGASGTTGTSGASATAGAAGLGSGGLGTAGASGGAGESGSGGAGSSGAAGSGASGAGSSGAGGSGAGASGSAGAGTSGSAGAAGGGTAGAGGGGAAGSGGTGGACPSSVLPAGDNKQTITSGGESRSFIVHVPAGYTGTSRVPVVLDFHPLGGTGSSQEGSSGWKAQCDSVGCIAVFPDSSPKAGDNSWNAGYCCNNAEKNQINDVQFARDMIEWLKTHACIDPKRVFASGGSNGGGMSYRLACDAADVIAAVAPVDFRCVTGTDPLANAGQLTAANNTACKCNLPRPISVVAYDEATDNSIVPYNGAQTPNLKTDCPPNMSCVGIGFPSAQVNFQTWANFDGCTGSATTSTENSICKQYSSCQNDTTVLLCTNNSSQHLAAYGSATAKVAATAWNVFKTQSLP